LDIPPSAFRSDADDLKKLLPSGFTDAYVSSFWPFIDYLVGRTNLVLDKATLKRLEDINALPTEAKEYVLNHIDIMIRDFKNKKAYGHK
jgi:hypothetical protein